MTDLRKLFAELTRAIEDLHGIAVEGQAPNLSPDIQLFLLTSIDAGMTSIGVTVRHASKAVMELQS